MRQTPAIRRFVLLALLASSAFPGSAARRLTVAQLEQLLSAGEAARKPDADFARQLREIELTERLSDAALEQLAAHLDASSQTALALSLLADKSQFLDAPAAEQPVATAPDDAAQQHLLTQARAYVAETLPRLPNLLATRTINRYDDSPQVLQKNAWPVHAGLHAVDSSSREISVGAERENQPANEGSMMWKREIGLISGGEFGSTLGMIMGDAAQGRVAWSHWEQGASGLVAVFHYAVPKSASHFEIIGSLKREATQEARATLGSRVASIGVQPNISSANSTIVHARPGYHGSLWLDAQTGAILRITIEADPKDSGLFKSTGIVVQYATVPIGNGMFVCPVRSLAVSVAASDVHDENAPTEWLNETLFTGYHRFASTTEILPADVPK